MITLDGYDPLSPTLQPSPIGGTCMGSRFAKWRTAWIDRSVPIVSGDLVRFHMRYSDGTITRIIKKLECTRDGKWYGVCNDGAFQVGVIGQERTIAQPHFVEKVVALSEEYWAPSPIVTMKADDALTAYYAELAQAAVAEWEQHGFPIGIPFPGLCADGFGDAL